MSRIAYVNGRYLPLARASIPVESRAAQFADGVYEVAKVVDGRIIDLDRHLARLRRSLDALAIPLPVTPAGLRQIINRTLARNRLRQALVYLQVDRGTAARNHLFPRGTRPALTVTVRRSQLPGDDELARGVGVIALPDERWARCDIKSIALLPNVLAKQRAAEAGCREAWLHDEAGRVTEGSSANAYIVDGHGQVITHPLGPGILGGVTRAVLLDLARGAGIAVAERPFSLAEARAAAEAFLTSTSSLVLPVTTIDGAPVGDGRPGPVTRHLLDLYRQHCGLRALGA